MSATLPPGWTGNDAESQIMLGLVRLTTYRPRRYNAIAREHQRGEWVHMRVALPTIDTETGKTDSTEARRVALVYTLNLLTSAARDAERALSALNDTEP